MTNTGRKPVTPTPRNAWDTMVEAAEGGAPPTQAGEVDTGYEDGLGGGDKGLDIETGSGGYGGDAVEAGSDEAVRQRDRPLDAEIHGDPRTRADEFYPNEVKVADQDQKPVGDELEEVLEEEEAEAEDEDEEGFADLEDEDAESDGDDDDLEDLDDEDVEGDEDDEDEEV